MISRAFELLDDRHIVRRIPGTLSATPIELGATFVDDFAASVNDWLFERLFSSVSGLQILRHVLQRSKPLTHFDLCGM